MKAVRHWWREAVIRHTPVRESLEAYVDGTLPAPAREAVDAHLLNCPDCARTLRQLQRLEPVLADLSQAPAVPFSRIWSKLEPSLPTRGATSDRIVSPRRLALAFALAVLASLSGLVALASDSVLPDSPLYAVKHLRQELQLGLNFDQPARQAVELGLAAERLHESAVMIDRDHPDLALQSLRDFHTLVHDAAPALRQPATRPSVAVLRGELERIEEANAEHGADSAIASTVDQELQALASVQVVPGDLAGPTPFASPPVSPSAVGTPRPAASPEASMTPTSQPLPSGSPRPSPSASETPTASPTASASATPRPSESGSPSPSPSR